MGHDFADKISQDAFEAIIAQRGNKILENKSLAYIVKDPQSLSMLFKRFNLGTPTELSAYLAGGYKFKLGVDTQPLPTLRGDEVFDVGSLQGEISGSLTAPGQVMLKRGSETEAVPTHLPQATGIIVKSTGFFIKSPQSPFNTIGRPLTFRLAGTSPIIFKSPTREDVLKPEGEVSIQDRRIIFKKVTYVSHVAKMTPEQMSGEEPLEPADFYENYARFLSGKHRIYKDSVKNIYFDNAAFFQDDKAMPDMSQPVDWSIWYALDPQNYLPFNVKTAIVEEWAKDARNQDKRPLDLTIIDEYLKTNRRIQGEMLRAVAPNEGANITDKKAWPGQASTHQMPYLGPDGKERRIAYRVNNAVVANGKHVLAEAARTPEGLAALDIAVGFGRFPSETPAPQMTTTPSPIQKLDSKQPGLRQVNPKPPAVRPKKSAFDGLQQLPLPQPIGFGGPEPLRRPAGPSAEDRAQIEADERMSAELAAFDRDQSLRSLVAAEVEQQLKPPPGRGKFEEAVLCGYNIYSYA